MRAAEKLIAANGVENVSIKHIVAAAEQKNESALQYHFGNLTGLLNAIHLERSGQVRARRDEILAATLATKPRPALRDLCRNMVEPSFQLARESTDFRRYIKAFGHELALTDSSPIKAVQRVGGGGKSAKQLGVLLREALPHLDEDAYLRRMDAAVMLASTSMYHQARVRSAFRGKQSDLFLQHLIDALVGLMSAPVSKETAAARN